MVGIEGISGALPESMGGVMSTREAFESRSGVYKRARFGRVVTAMVTPFREDGSLNLDMAQELAHSLSVSGGSEGILLAGTTGEAPTLKPEEHAMLVEAVDDVVDVPILVGTGSNNPEEAVELTRAVERQGLAAGVLLVTPYYSKPGQSGIEDYFSQVLSATGLDALVYDIPGRTGRPIAVETVRRLADRFKNLVGIKDAAGDPEKSKQLLEIDSDFELYSGDDGRNRKLYKAGAVGAISVASHWAGHEIATMFTAIDNREYALAKKIDKILKPSCKFETNDYAPNPIPTKAMLRAVIGIDVGYGRSPMRGTDRENLQLELQANEVYERLRQEFAELTGAPRPSL